MEAKECVLSVGVPGTELLYIPAVGSARTWRGHSLVRGESLKPATESLLTRFIIHIQSTGMRSSLLVHNDFRTCRSESAETPAQVLFFWMSRSSFTYLYMYLYLYLYKKTTANRVSMPSLIAHFCTSRYQHRCLTFIYGGFFGAQFHADGTGRITRGEQRAVNRKLWWRQAKSEK